MDKFTASPETVGEWHGQEIEAATCWNTYVAPELQKLHTQRIDEPGEDDGIAEAVQNQAWEKFCATTDDESWAELGERVATFVRA